MPPSLTPESLAQTVVAGGLVTGLVLGMAAQASRFCVRGAVADWVLERHPARAATWLLAIVVAALGTQALVAAGAFDATRALAWTSRFTWLSFIVGGFLFGLGMVLAEGCPQRSLVKLGAGNLKALVTLVFAGLAAQMTLRGILASPRTSLLDATAVDLRGPQDLGSLGAGLVSASAQPVRIVLTLVVALLGALVLWRVRARLTRAQWIGGAIVGALVPVAWWLTGHLGFLAEHPETLEPAWLGTAGRRPEALSFTAPLAAALDWLTLWSDANMVLTFGVTLAFGVLVGSAVSSRVRGEFRVEGFASPAQFGHHVLGGTLMGFGGVAAAGCSIGQGVTGLAMLSAGAVLAIVSMVAGAWVALKWRHGRAGVPLRTVEPVVAAD